MKIAAKDFIKEMTDDLRSGITDTSWFVYLIFNAIALIEPDNGKEIIEYLHEKSDEGKDIEILLTIDGKNLNVREIFEHVGKVYDEAVLKKAEKLIDEKFKRISDLTFEVEEGLKRIISEEMHKKYPELYE